MFFPLDNTTGDCAQIRTAIEQVTSEQEYLKQEVSLRWLHCLDKLFENKKVSYYSLAQTEKIAAGLEIKNGLELENMLKLFHQLGVIIYFTATQALRDVVVTDPQASKQSINELIKIFVLGKKSSHNSLIN